MIIEGGMRREREICRRRLHLLRDLNIHWDPGDGAIAGVPMVMIATMTISSFAVDLVIPMILLILHMNSTMGIISAEAQVRVVNRESNAKATAADRIVKIVVILPIVVEDKEIATEGGIIALVIPVERKARQEGIEGDDEEVDGIGIAIAIDSLTEGTASRKMRGIIEMCLMTRAVLRI